MANGEPEYLIYIDQDGRTIKVSEEDYKANLDLFNNINIEEANLPSWLKKNQT